VMNTAKTGITSAQASAIETNTAKTGITSGQASAIEANTAKTGITSEQASAIESNTAKVVITSEQASAIEANTAKTGISIEQALAILQNTQAITNVYTKKETNAAISKAIALVVKAAPDAFNTLKELSNYMTAPTVAKSVVNRLGGLEKELTALRERVAELEEELKGEGDSAN